MIIKDKQQAADQGTHGPILLAAWEAGEARVVVGGKEYEFVREPEPVEMYTDSELERRRGTRDLIALITEHIEANRPVLTNEIVSGWYGEFCEKSARRFSVDDACQYVAHRAAEYRSPAVAELRAENERLKNACERTKGYDTWMKTAKSLGEELDALKATRSPQPIDDSDKYGILVQEGCVALVNLSEEIDDCGCIEKRWKIKVPITGVATLYRIDKRCIFKVTSQPRGPLKVPSKRDMKDDLKAEEKEFGELSGDYDAGFTSGAEWAIDWIKKANGAE